MLFQFVKYSFYIGEKFKYMSRASFFKKVSFLVVKPSLHEPQLPIGRSVTLVSFIVVERRRCALQASSFARLQENKET